MEPSYWEQFILTGNPDLYIKFKETENGHGTGEDDGRGPSDSEWEKQ